MTALGSAEEALEVSAKGAPARAPERSVDAGEGWLLVDRPGSCATTRARRGHSGRRPHAYSGPEHRASVLRAGFKYHVVKPGADRELIGVVAILALKE